MRQMLIVDDEIIAVQGLREGLNWSELGITAVHAAYSSEQAKQMFEREDIDVLLCDIEMPQGTGLELLEWVREHYPKTETIFLTCHADFKYAKQAMQLGSLDYLLKPIPHQELKDTVQKALNKLEQESQQNEFSQYGKYWVRHQPLLVERFWTDILNQSIPSHADIVKRAAAERNIPYSIDMTFMPVLIHVKRWFKNISLRDEKIMEYAIRKSAEEVILNDLDSGLLITLGDGYWLAWISGESELVRDAKLREKCSTFIEACRSYFYAGVCCYIGEIARGHQAASMYRKLRRLDADNVVHDQGVFSLEEPLLGEHREVPPDMSMWAVLLEEGKKEQLLKVVEEYLKARASANRVNLDTLTQFVQDFQQMVYYTLKVKGIQAHKLFSGNPSMDLNAFSTRSITDSLNWLRHLIQESADFIVAMDQTQSVVDKVKGYISEHLEEDISREDIANYVYLNPDYLTRIFKKETGLSISEYLLNQRLDMAAGLLVNTDMPVHVIAGRIGYANFSHFSRMFKKHRQLNPVDYRNKYQTASLARESRESDTERS